MIRIHILLDMKYDLTTSILKFPHDLSGESKWKSEFIFPIEKLITNRWSDEDFHSFFFRLVNKIHSPKWILIYKMVFVQINDRISHLIIWSSQENILVTDWTQTYEELWTSNCFKFNKSKFKLFQTFEPLNLLSFFAHIQFSSQLLQNDPAFRQDYSVGFWILRENANFHY